MLLSNLPTQLTIPFIIADRVVSKVMLDLTAYLIEPSEQELEFLVELYEYFCPTDRLVNYKISEIEYWVPLTQPELTASGRYAAAAGIKRPYLEPVRQRVRQGRAFEIQFWDGRGIDDPEGSWSFCCRRIHLRSSGLHAFVRFLIPLSADYQILLGLANSITNNVKLYSGHGGLVFAYNPWFKETALDHIYAQAKRFWGVDVEDLNVTLPLMKKGIKGINWITILGRCLFSGNDIETVLACLSKIKEVKVGQHQYGNVLMVGLHPVAGDQNWPDRTLDPYFAVAKKIETLFLTYHPDFSGELFINNGNTMGWIRRFIDPSGWR